MRCSSNLQQCSKLEKKVLEYKNKTNYIFSKYDPTFTKRYYKIRRR